MEDCIFCKIINKEIPADIIYEDANVLAFLDLRPVTRAHTLVVPKKHAANILEMDSGDLSAFMPSFQKVAQAVVKATGAAGFNTHVNTGAKAGQVVFHTHFHIIPRYGTDTLKMWPHSEVEPQTRVDQAQEIRKFLS